jgi:hypothetical protein
MRKVSETLVKRMDKTIAEIKAAHGLITESQVRVLVKRANECGDDVTAWDDVLYENNILTEEQCQKGLDWFKKNKNRKTLAKMGEAERKMIFESSWHTAHLCGLVNIGRFMPFYVPQYGHNTEHGYFEYHMEQGEVVIDF